MNKDSHLLRIHWLRKNSVRILPAESKSGKRKKKSSTLNLNAINPILRQTEICEPQTFAASRESSQAPSGLAVALSSQSLNPSYTGGGSQIFTQERCSKIIIASLSKQSRATSKQIGPGTGSRFVRGALAGSLLPPLPTCKSSRSSVSKQLRGEAKSRLTAYPSAWPTSRWRDLSARGSIRRFLGGLTCSSSPLPSPPTSPAPSESSEYGGGGGARRWCWSGGSWESLTTSLSLRRRRSDAEEPPPPPESELDGSGDGLRWRGREGEDDGEEGKGKKSSTSGREETAAARRGRSERRAGGEGERPPRWWWWSIWDEGAPTLRRAGCWWCLSGDGDGDGDGDRGMAACPAAVRVLASLGFGLLGFSFLAAFPFFSSLSSLRLLLFV